MIGLFKFLWKLIFVRTQSFSLKPGLFLFWFDWRVNKNFQKIRFLLDFMFVVMIFDNHHYKKKAYTLYCLHVLPNYAWPLIILWFVVFLLLEFNGHHQIIETVSKWLSTSRPNSKKFVVFFTPLIGHFSTTAIKLWWSKDTQIVPFVDQSSHLFVWFVFFM